MLIAKAVADSMRPKIVTSFDSAGLPQVSLEGDVNPETLPIMGVVAFIYRLVSEAIVLHSESSKEIAKDALDKFFGMMDVEERTEGVTSKEDVYKFDEVLSKLVEGFSMTGLLRRHFVAMWSGNPDLADCDGCEHFRNCHGESEIPMDIDDLPDEFKDFFGKLKPK
jgi:hypothetical protein